MSFPFPLVSSQPTNLPLQKLIGFRIWFMVLFIFLLSGCASFEKLVILPRLEPDLQEKAEQMFINGDFKNALLEFEHIHETTLSAKQKNRALYGLACTQIMLAETDRQLAEGIRNLSRWDAEKGGKPMVENHHLLVLALMRQRERLLNQYQEREIQAQHQKRQILQQKKMINRLGETMSNLQKQLEELEALDEHYQEKKRR